MPPGTSPRPAEIDGALRFYGRLQWDANGRGERRRSARPQAIERAPGLPLRAREPPRVAALGRGAGLVIGLVWVRRGLRQAREEGFRADGRRAAAARGVLDGPIGRDHGRPRPVLAREPREDVIGLVWGAGEDDPDATPSGWRRRGA